MPAYMMGATGSGSSGMPQNYMEYMQYQQQQRSKMLLWGGLILALWQSSNQATVEQQRSTTISDNLKDNITAYTVAGSGAAEKTALIAALNDIKDGFSAGSTATGIFGGGTGGNNNTILLLGVVLLASSGGF